MQARLQSDQGVLVLDMLETAALASQDGQIAAGRFVLRPMRLRYLAGGNEAESLVARPAGVA